MLTRDQCYAINVHKKANTILADKNFSENEGSKRKVYGSMAHKLPILIRTAGLVQALTFVQTRKTEPLTRLLTDLAKTIGKNDENELLASARNAELNAYMHLTQQVLDALLWYKRFAQSVLGVEESDSIEEDKIDGQTT